MSEEQRHILIVEDEIHTRKLLCLYLDAQGFTTSTAENGDEMRQKLAENTIDLVLMDLVLPGEDGLVLTRHIREKYQAGIIILTSKSDTVDRIVGLEIGADDYVTKPFDERELLARIRSVLSRLNRSGGETSAGGPDPHSALPGRNIVRFENWLFDLGARRLMTAEGTITELTSSEYNLLAEFVANPGIVLSRDQLSNTIHNRDWEPLDRSIDVLVTRLRRKLEGDTRHPTIIKTVRGSGYVFSAEITR